MTLLFGGSKPPPYIPIHYPTKYCVNPTTSGMVISENIAEADTIPAESSVLRPNFAAIMVVNAATGALTAIPFTEDDRRTLMAVGEPLFLRAAALTAVNVSAAVLRTGEGRDPLHPVCVTIDGSTYYKTRTAMFKSRVEQGLRDILGARGVSFDTVFVEDAPMIGSAVAGLIA